MTSLSERRSRVELIREAHFSGARLTMACQEAGVSLRTYRRWYRQRKVHADRRPEAVRPEPANKLAPEEQQQILAACNEPEYASLPPSQIVPTLLDEGIYLGSVSSFYRVLKAHAQLHHRGRSLSPKKVGKPSSYRATGPNQVWTWDITYLASRIKGQFYYLYMFEDIYSRKIVGYEVHDSESGELSAQLIQRCILREQCFNQPLVLHSDNGAPMKSSTMRAKLEELGVIASHNRPRVSNDNPFSESLFRTLKYCPQWPSSGFKSLTEARDWVQQFVDWYNDEHKHSKLNFVTPAQRHDGKDAEILSKRKKVLDEAKARNPLRWSGNTINCDPIGAVTLNPDKELQESETQVA